MIRISTIGDVGLDRHIQRDKVTLYQEAKTSFLLVQDCIFLKDETDGCLGVCYQSFSTWEYREDYTGSHLPHYLNYFMVHLVDGYLQTGEY